MTVPPKRGYKVLEFFWDLKNEQTGEMVPPDKKYMAIIEFCGEFLVDEERIGVIPEPLKVYGTTFFTGMEKEVIHLPPAGGEQISPPPIGVDPSKPPKPPSW